MDWDKTHDFKQTIRDSKNQKELLEKATLYMNAMVQDWWDHVGNDVKAALKLLGYSYTTISGLMFFSDSMVVNFGITEDYKEWMEEVKAKIESADFEADSGRVYGARNRFDHMQEIRETYLKDPMIMKIRNNYVKELVLKDLLENDEEYVGFLENEKAELDGLRKSLLWDAVDEIVRKEQ